MTYPHKDDKGVRFFNIFRQVIRAICLCQFGVTIKKYSPAQANLIDIQTYLGSNR